MSDLGDRHLFLMVLGGSSSCSSIVAGRLTNHACTCQHPNVPNSRLPAEREAAVGAVLVPHGGFKMLSSGLPPEEAPVMIAEKPNLFCSFLFFCFQNAEEAIWCARPPCLLTLRCARSLSHVWSLCPSGLCS